MNELRFNARQALISAYMRSEGARRIACYAAALDRRRVLPMDIFHVLLAVGLVSSLVYIYKQARDKD